MNFHMRLWYSCTVCASEVQQGSRKSGLDVIKWYPVFHFFPPLLLFKEIIWRFLDKLSLVKKK